MTVGMRSCEEELTALEVILCTVWEGFPKHNCCRFFKHCIFFFIKSIYLV